MLMRLLDGVQLEVYTPFDKSGTVRVGRYQDPRAQMGHLISNFYPDGTLSCCFSAKHVLQVLVSWESQISS